MSKVKALSLQMDKLGNRNTIHPVLIWDDDGATLVDAGYPGQFDRLKKAVTRAGVPFRQIRRVIVTHQDWDHIGTLPDILAALGGQTEILAHVEEQPYLEGDLPYIKMNPGRIAARLEALPADLRPGAAELFAKVPHVRVGRVLEDGERLPFHGGIEIVHTPGHTPGHICLYLPSHHLLIAGDQLRVEEGKLVGPSDVFTPDMPAALKSLEKLCNYDVDSVICYHGGFFGPGASIRINALAREAAG